MSWSIYDHIEWVVNDHRKLISNPKRGIDLLEYFDAAHECKHGNIPGRPGSCGCFAPLVFIPPRKQEISKKPASVMWMSQKDIERYVGAGYKWVNIRLREYVNLAKVKKNKAGQNSLHYPLHVANDLRRQRREFERCPEAGTYLTIDDLLALVSKSRLWISKTLFREGFKPEKRRSPKQRVTDYYPPEVVTVLLQLAAEYPPSNDWVTLHQIAKLLKAEYSWVRRRIDELAIKGEMRTRPGYGRPFIHYPPDTVTKLALSMNKYPLGDGWYTAYGLAERLGRSYNWVLERLQDYETFAEIRLDAQRVPRIHYPAVVYESLHGHSELLKLIGGRKTVGLEFRIHLIGLIGRNKGATVNGLAGNITDKKKTYDALRWLEERGLVLVAGNRGRCKIWELTEKGRLLSSILK